MELSKQELRLRYLSRLKLDEKRCSEASLQIVDKLIGLLARAKGPVAVFRALSTEPILEKLTQTLNLDWVFPRVEAESMSFYRSTWDELQPGAYGVFEPRPEESHLVPLSQIEWVLIPGVSFDRHGTRLGRGKAFYDKTLVNFKGNRVGVSYYEGISNFELPKEDHDLNMDWLVTDRFILRPLAA